MKEYEMGVVFTDRRKTDVSDILPKHRNALMKQENIRRIQLKKEYKENIS